MADNRRTILVIDGYSQAGRAPLEARSDVRVVDFPSNMSRAAFLDLIRSEPRVDAMVLGVQAIGPDEIAAAQHLAVVARVGVGYDAIDVPALTKARIPLMTTGIANSPSVAEKALYLMLTLAKRGASMDAMVREGRWRDRMQDMPIDLCGKTVLVIGFGRIGSRTAKRCLAMEMDVLIADPLVAPETIKAAGCEPVTLDDALPRADFITIHCPKTPETTGLIGSKQLALMKPSAYLVNTARGGLIDEAALANALTHGRLAGAGLDVLLDEPPPTDHPLFKLNNVVFAPHMAGVTREAFDRMAEQAALNILSVFDGKPIAANVVNREVV